MSNLLDTIFKINPWYKTGKVPDVLLETFVRREFNELSEAIENTELATLLLGGRRVGKSVLMYQLIQSLLDKGVDAKHILFIQGDNPILRECDEDGKILNQILKNYENYILSKDFVDLEKKVYIFIDEAQVIKDWEGEIKSLLDLKYKIKYFITGSSSSQLRQGINAPLLGRVDLMVIPPFSFYDFVSFNIFNNKNKEYKNFKTKLDDYVKDFKKSFWEGNRDEVFEIAKKAMETLSTNYKIPQLYEEYIFFGGYPWVIKYKGKENTEKYLRDMLTMTISKDISTQGEVRETVALERLFVNLTMSIGSSINIDSIAKKIGIDPRTAQRYADYYADSHLIYISTQFNFFDKKLNINKDSKLYIIDNGLVNILAMKSQKDLLSDKGLRGALVENNFYGLLFHFRQQSTGSFQNDIPHWRYEDGTEIDYIFEIDKAVIPIEAKARNTISDDQLTGIINFLEQKKKAKFGIVISDKELRLDFEKNMIIVPSFILSLLM